MKTLSIMINVGVDKVYLEAIEVDGNRTSGVQYSTL